MESKTKIEINSSLLTYAVKLGWINFPGKDVLVSKLMCSTMVLSTYSELGISKYDRILRIASKQGEAGGEKEIEGHGMEKIEKNK